MDWREEDLEWARGAADRFMKHRTDHPCCHGEGRSCSNFGPPGDWLGFTVRECLDCGCSKVEVPPPPLDSPAPGE